MDKPAPASPQLFGSDIIAEAIRDESIPYVCINPGASYRGLHDSLVNHLGNKAPRIILCLHEEHAVAIAHGYAAVTGKPLAAIVHSGVGLMHASMAIFNAWCARVPVLVIGATGPVDAARRRPWIDWIHTAADQGALVRDYTKWDDQPGSPAAAVEAIRRGMLLGTTRPAGPVYINLDAAIQEQPLAERPPLHARTQFAQPAEPEPAPADVERLLTMLSEAKNAILLSGRMSRDEAAFTDRQRLAECAALAVITDTKDPASFSSDHANSLGETTMKLRPDLVDTLREADLIIAFDWVDLAGTLAQIIRPGETLPRIVNVSTDFHIHRGWSADYQGLPPSALHLATTPEAVTRALLRHLENNPIDRQLARRLPAAPIPVTGRGEAMGIADLARLFGTAAENETISIMSRPIGWPLDANPIRHPLDFLGRAAGGGLGAGPGMIVGAALALRDMGEGRIPVAILGDGDYMMGLNALWTAAAEGIPLLIIVANNRSYYNDEEHQKHIARHRGRPEENAPIGQRLEGPELDLAMLARGQGLEAEGPVTDASALPAALQRAFAAVKAGKSYVLDVIVRPEYDNRSLAGRP